jgi:chemotaxis protein MotB
MADDSSSEQPIIIKKIKKGGGHAHGGAWKVAYADFVTAMMAFFIVMWIIAASEETKESVTAYFDDPGAFNFINGKRTVPIDLGMKPIPGSILGENIGEGSGRSEIDPPENEDELYFKNKERLKAEAKADSIAFADRVKVAAQKIQEILEEELEQDETLQEIMENIIFNYDEKGLRIDLIENNDNLFFTSGSANLRAEVTDILKVLSVEIGKLPNYVEIEGHTDSKDFSKGAKYTNWELSSDRANSARRILSNYGLWWGQINRVTGFADTRLHNKDNPFDKTNRRISILIKNKKIQEFYDEKIKEDIPFEDADEVVASDSTASKTISK